MKNKIIKITILFLLLFSLWEIAPETFYRAMIVLSIVALFVSHAQAMAYSGKSFTDDLI